MSFDLRKLLLAFVLQTTRTYLAHDDPTAQIGSCIPKDERQEDWGGGWFGVHGEEERWEEGRRGREGVRCLGEGFPGRG